MPKQAALPGTPARRFDSLGLCLATNAEIVLHMSDAVHKFGEILRPLTQSARCDSTGKGPLRFPNFDSDL